MHNQVAKLNFYPDQCRQNGYPIDEINPIQAQPLRGKVFIHIYSTMCIVSSKDREKTYDNPLESTFVRELKHELNLRSEVATRKADLNKQMVTGHHQSVHKQDHVPRRDMPSFVTLQTAQRPISKSDERHYQRNFEQQQAMQHHSRSRSKSPNSAFNNAFISIQPQQSVQEPQNFRQRSRSPVQFPNFMQSASSVNLQNHRQLHLDQPAAPEDMP